MAVEGQNSQSISRKVAEPRITQVNLNPDGVLVILAGNVAEALAGDYGAKVGPALPPALWFESCLLWLLFACARKREDSVTMSLMQAAS